MATKSTLTAISNRTVTPKMATIAPKIATQRTKTQQKLHVKGEMGMITRKNAIVLNIANRMSQCDFLNELSTVVHPNNIVSCSRQEDNFIVYLLNSAEAGRLIKSGIVLNNEKIIVRTIYREPVKVIISNFLPHLPNKLIVDFLKQFGRTETSHLTPIPIDADGNDTFKHVLSHRRQIFMHMKPNVRLPGKVVIVDVDHSEYEIRLSVELNAQQAEPETTVKSERIP